MVGFHYLHYLEIQCNISVRIIAFTIILNSIAFPCSDVFGAIMYKYVFILGIFTVLLCKLLGQRKGKKYYCCERGSGKDFIWFTKNVRPDWWFDVCSFKSIVKIIYFPLACIFSHI